MNKKNDEITIQGIVDIFLPKIWIIALIAVVCGAVFGCYSAFLTKDSYTSGGKYMVIKTSTSSPDQMTSGLSSSDIVGMQGMIANAQEILKTHDFYESVMEELGRDDISIEQFRNMTTVSLSNSDATCYDVKVTSSDAELSHELATIAGNQMMSKFTDTNKYAYAVKRIDTARVAEEPNDKNTLRNTVIGALAGALLTMVVIFVYDRFDVVIRTREKIEHNFDIPILGVIPRLEVNK